MYLHHWQLFSLRALRELTCRDDRAKRLVVEHPYGCQLLVSCCRGGVDEIEAGLHESGTEDWEDLVQMQSVYACNICFLFYLNSIKCNYSHTVSQIWWLYWYQSLHLHVVLRFVVSGLTLLQLWLSVYILHNNNDTIQFFLFNVILTLQS